MSVNRPAMMLETEYKRLCEEYDHFHQWAIQANAAVRLEYNRHFDQLHDKKEEAGQRLKMVSEVDEHLKEHMTNAAIRAIDVFKSALADAKSQTARARPQPPFLY